MQKTNTRTQKAREYSCTYVHVTHTHAHMYIKFAVLLRCVGVVVICFIYGRQTLSVSSTVSHRATQDETETAVS